ncbi:MULTISPECIES: NfeD family protein [unclassified Alteromonas]|jgi:membrane protein implicated in regulation of membrane protease activity|uniref:NfeD family protein n=1 Tax=unclassified Alteromonas TaxID=2614992 RepID=UPI0005096493|nr:MULTISPECIES: NfeD family protein [unclassified Alteromonas]
MMASLENIENIESYLLALGLVLMIAELLLGFSIILLFTLGVSLLITSGLVFLNVFEPSLLNLFIAVSVLDTLLMVLLWKPMKYLQRDKAPQSVKSDLVGNVIELTQDTGPTHPSTVQYSGVTWKVKCSEPLHAGTQVVIEDVEVGSLIVKINR